MKQKEKLLAFIDAQIKEPYREAMKGFVQASVRLRTSTKSVSEIGVSRLGGVPDLPMDMFWPTAFSDQIPLLFLGQINLAEIHSFDINDELPSEGMLYFFLHPSSWEEGKVIYAEASFELDQTLVPEVFKTEEPKKPFWKRLFRKRNPYILFESCLLNPEIEYHFPSWNSLQADLIKSRLNIPGRTVDMYKNENYYEDYWEGESEMTSKHHLLGHYNGIQGEYYQLEAAGIKKSFRKIKPSDIEKALEWKLLFQLDSDRNTKMHWADWGKLYFFIPQSDLKERNFDQVKIILDCY